MSSGKHVYVAMVRYNYYNKWKKIASSLTSMYWLFPLHLDSKQTLGFEPSLEIRECRDNVACPGNQVQTCGCMENQDLYPMVVQYSQLGNHI